MAHATLASIRDLAPLIAQHADEAERERRLARPVVDALVETGVFRLLLPPALGGAGASPLEFCEVIETVSTVDGSTGWCVMISGGYGQFAGLLPPPAAAEIFGNRAVRALHRVRAAWHWSPRHHSIHDPRGGEDADLVAGTLEGENGRPAGCGSGRGFGARGASVPSRDGPRRLGDGDRRHRLVVGTTRPALAGQHAGRDSGRSRGRVTLYRGRGVRDLREHRFGALPDLSSRLERFTIALSCNGELRDTGRGSNVLGGPLAAAGHLIALLAKQPQAKALQAGELVTTGTLTAAFPDTSRRNMEHDPRRHRATGYLRYLPKLKRRSSESASGEDIGTGQPRDAGADDRDTLRIHCS